MASSRSIRGLQVAGWRHVGQYPWRARRWPKTATKLIQDYGTLEDLLEHVDDLPRARTSLLENRDQAIQSKYLATIVRDAPISLDLEGAKALRYDTERVMSLPRA